MKRRFTSGERKGLIVLLVVMGVCIALAAIRRMPRSVGKAPEPQPIEVPAPIDSVTAKMKDDSCRHTNRRSKKPKSKGAVSKSAKSVAPSRSPLDERNN